MPKEAIHSLVTTQGGYVSLDVDRQVGVDTVFIDIFLYFYIICKE